MQVVVILEHDGDGDRAVPVALIEVTEPEDWKIEAWFKRHQWRVAYRDGNPVWVKERAELYGVSTKFAAISDPMDVEAAR